MQPDAAGPRRAQVHPVHRRGAAAHHGHGARGQVHGHREAAGGLSCMLLISSFTLVVNYYCVSCSNSVVVKLSSCVALPLISTSAALLRVAAQLEVAGVSQARRASVPEANGAVGSDQQRGRVQAHGLARHDAAEAPAEKGRGELLALAEHRRGGDVEQLRREPPARRGDKLATAGATDKVEARQHRGGAATAGRLALHPAEALHAPRVADAVREDLPVRGGHEEGVVLRREVEALHACGRGQANARAQLSRQLSRGQRFTQLSTAFDVVFHTLRQLKKAVRVCFLGPLSSTPSRVCRRRGGRRRSVLRQKSRTSRASTRGGPKRWMQPYINLRVFLKSPGGNPPFFRSPFGARRTSEASLDAAASSVGPARSAETQKSTEARMGENLFRSSGEAARWLAPGPLAPGAPAPSWPHILRGAARVGLA